MIEISSMRLNKIDRIEENLVNELLRIDCQVEMVVNGLLRIDWLIKMLVNELLRINRQSDLFNFKLQRTK